MNEGLEALVIQLQRSVEQLTKRVEKLEDENTNLKKWISKEKKKVSVQQWLTDNWNPSTSYVTWQKNIQLSQRDLENVFKYGFAGGVSYIIQRQLPLAEHKTFPIVGFKKRGMVFYIYNEDKWRVMENHELEGLARSINTKLFACFAEWERINPAIMAEPGRKQWNRNLKKILLLPEKLETTIKKIRNRLFQYLQMDLKNITEYEFSF